MRLLNLTSYKRGNTTINFMVDDFAECRLALNERGSNSVVAEAGLTDVWACIPSRFVTKNSPCRLGWREIEEMHFILLISQL